MWPQIKFPADSHSDQSISDEDDVDTSWPDNCVSLGSSVNEEGLQLPLRLEMLKGATEFNCRTGYNENYTSSFKTVGVPDTSNIDEEVISDEEENNALSKITVAPGAEDMNRTNLFAFGNEMGDGAESKEWFNVIKETKQIHSNANAPCSSSYATCSEARQYCKGLRGKAKPKFSFQNRSKSGCLKQEKNASSFVNAAFERLENTKFRSIEDSLPEFVEEYPQDLDMQAKTFLGEDEAHHAEFVKHSMVELLDGLWDNKHVAVGKSKTFRRKGKREKLLSKNDMAIVNRTHYLEGSPEPVDTGSSSSDEEVNFQNPKLDLPEIKKKTMADRFQDIVGDTALKREEFILGAANQSGNGLYGKLQKVILLQKEGDLDFSKKLQTAFDTNCVPGCACVKILSKYLDGQMTVCDCCFIQNKEFQQPDIVQTALYNDVKRQIVIFNSRICSDVELEVGNLIRIIPPWKEVTGKFIDGNIIMSMYYCQM